VLTRSFPTLRLRPGVLDITLIIDLDLRAPHPVAHRFGPLLASLDLKEAKALLDELR
jgi:hypothetical protein